jgi:acetoin utilization protein AcuB
VHVCRWLVRAAYSKDRHMAHPPNLASAMTPFPYSIESASPLRTALDTMTEHAVRHLPVTNSHELVGVISYSDIMAALTENAGEEALDTLKVQDICVSDVYVVELDEPLENVLLTLADRHIGSAVVTRHGRLAGVFTWIDACRCFGEYLRENFPRPGGDEAA